MNVTITYPVQLSLITLSDDERRRMNVWFDYLKQWGRDEFLAANTKKLSTAGNVYLLDTLTDHLIFFSVEGDDISILNVARRDTVEMFREAVAHQRA